jgi:hypothetical protein
MSEVVHDFDSSLAFEKQHADDILWPKIYMAAFPDYIGRALSNSLEEQKRGIDAYVRLSLSRTVAVDEKLRTTTFDDVCIEWASVYRNGKIVSLGWACKPLDCDYVVYAVPRSKWAILIPHAALVKAMSTYGVVWRGKYPKIVANNSGYQTLSTGVPVPVLTSAVPSCIKVPL